MEILLLMLLVMSLCGNMYLVFLNTKKPKEIIKEIIKEVAKEEEPLTELTDEQKITKDALDSDLKEMMGYNMDKATQRRVIIDG